MKKLFLCLYLAAAAAFAETPSPALQDYRSQVTCATQKALDEMGDDVIKQSVLLRAAEACVPEAFKPVLEGLPEGVKPPTRNERVTSIANSAAGRIKLCESTGVRGTSRASECAKIFRDTP